MSLTVNTDTYNGDSYGLNQVTYTGPDHTVSKKDVLLLKRVAPKPSDVFSGVGRTTAKLTRTLTLTGAKTPSGDLIVDVSVSLPVGYASADLTAALADIGAFVVSTHFASHVSAQRVSF